jgi:hypothetical protein
MQDAMVRVTQPHKASETPHNVEFLKILDLRRDTTAERVEQLYITNL